MGKAFDDAPCISCPTFGEAPWTQPASVEPVTAINYPVPYFVCVLASVYSSDGAQAETLPTGGGGSQTKPLLEKPGTGELEANDVNYA